MNPPVSKDFERLSAYIDDQLSPAEKADLEARLARDPQLKASLDDLRRTVLAVRNLPKVKPPRNFTLTREQVGERARRGRLFPVMRLAAALCTLLLVVTVARDWATSGNLAAPAVNQPAGAGSAASTLAAPQAAPLESPTPEANRLAFGASAPATPSTPAVDQATTPRVHMSTIQPSATPGPTLKGVGPSETPAQNTSVSGGTSPAGLPAAAGSPTPFNGTSEGNHATEAGGTPEGTPMSMAALAPAATDTAVPGQAPAPQAPQTAPFNPWRLVEIVLAVLALGLAGATWLTRRG